MEANNDSAIYFELLAEERQAKAEQNRLDAERYRKLKAAISEDHKRFDGEGYSISDGSKALSTGDTFDSAVDALPDPKENSNRRR